WFADDEPGIRRVLHEPAGSRLVNTDGLGNLGDAEAGTHRQLAEHAVPGHPRETRVPAAMVMFARRCALFVVRRIEAVAPTTVSAKRRSVRAAQAPQLGESGVNALNVDLTFGIHVC